MLDPHALVVWLGKLAQNNNRPWFEAEKPRYQALRRDFADAVQQIIYGTGEADPAIQPVSAESAIFRIYRDVRFSKDKTPYKTVFNASINPDGRAGGMPGYYFQINERGILMAAAGVWMPETAVAARIRSYIANHAPQVAATLDDPMLRSFFPQGVAGESLKRAPRGFAEDALLIDLIKQKHFVLWREDPVPAQMNGNEMVENVTASLRAATPWVIHLRAALRGHVPAARR